MSFQYFAPFKPMAVCHIKEKKYLMIRPSFTSNLFLYNAYWTYFTHVFFLRAGARSTQRTCAPARKKKMRPICLYINPQKFITTPKKTSASSRKNLNKGNLSMHSPVNSIKLRPIAPLPESEERLLKRVSIKSTSFNFDIV